MRSIGLAAALVLVGCGEPRRAAEERRAPAAEPQDQKEPAGSWVKARKIATKREVTSAGTFKARQSSRLGSQVSGRVEQVLVDVGDAVKAKQELVRLDRTLFAIEVDQRKADVAAAQVAVDEAELNFTRMKNLFEKPQGEQPSVPRKLYDDAKSRKDGAAAKLRQEEEKLRFAAQRLKETIILAPYDGVVTARLVDPGEAVLAAPATSLLEIEDVGSLELEFALAQELLSRIAKGTQVAFDVEGIAGGPFAGGIEVVYPMVDRASRTFRCRVLVENGKGLFRPGLLAQVKIGVGGGDVVVVPRPAVVDGKVRTRAGSTPVGTGAGYGDDVEIVSGLKDGDEVFVPEPKR
jgi:membrane fusion protein (multidrug efflux system)